jgi:hypothetical protein
MSGLHYLAVAAACYAIFYYLGFPLARLVRGGQTDPYGTSSVLFGISLFTSAAWTWTWITGEGVRPLIYGLALANLLPFALAVRGTRPTRARITAVSGPLLALFAASFAVFWHYNTDVVGRKVLAATFGNADLPVYALLAEHLTRAGFGDKGFIAGADLGFYTQTDYFGAFALPTVPSVLALVEPARAVMPMLFLAMFLTVTALAGLLARLGGLNRATSGALALLACSSSLYFYSVGQGFFAQVFAMALVVKLVEVTLAILGPQERRAFLRHIAEMTVYLMGLLCVYQHMAFLCLPILLGVAVLATLVLRAPLTPLLRLAVAVPVSLGTACLLLAPRADIAVHKTFQAEGTPAGWILPRAQLSQILGFQLYPNAPGLPSTVPDHSAALAAVSWRSVATAVIAGAVLLLLVRMVVAHLPEAQRRLASWSTALLVVPLASYYAFYGYFGPSYQQWKWLAFYQPLLVLGMLAFVAALLAAQPFSAWRVGALSWAWVAGVGLLTLTIQPSPHETRLDATVADLRDHASLRDADGVNVSATTKDTFWDTMWTAYFFADKRALLLTPSYFPTHAADSGLPTIRRAGDQADSVEPARLPVASSR